MVPKPQRCIFNERLRPSQETVQTAWLGRWDSGYSLSEAVLNTTPHPRGLGEHPRLGAELRVWRSACERARGQPGGGQSSVLTLLFLTTGQPT